MSVIPESRVDLLERPLYAHFATLREDGSLQVNPMWVAWDGTHLRLTGTTSRQKHRNIQHEPRVALSVVDPEQPYRYLEVRGTVVGIEDDSDGGRFFLSLADVYGMEMDGPPHDVAQRVVYVVRPDRTSH